MNEKPPAKPSARFDPIGFTVATPMATPRELAVAFGQLIDSISDLTGVSVERIITATLSAITVSWRASTIPSAVWLDDVEEQLQAFAACTGVALHFRKH
jgi:hypothetical protein